MNWHVNHTTRSACTRRSWVWSQAIRRQMQRLWAAWYTWRPSSRRHYGRSDISLFALLFFFSNYKGNKFYLFTFRMGKKYNWNGCKNVMKHVFTNTYNGFHFHIITCDWCVSDIIGMVCRKIPYACLLWNTMEIITDVLQNHGYKLPLRHQGKVETPIESWPLDDRPPILSAWVHWILWQGIKEVFPSWSKPENIILQTSRLNPPTRLLPQSHGWALSSPSFRVSSPFIPLLTSNGFISDSTRALAKCLNWGFAFKSRVANPSQCPHRPIIPTVDWTLCPSHLRRQRKLYPASPLHRRWSQTTSASMFSIPALLLLLLLCLLSFSFSPEVSKYYSSTQEGCNNYRQVSFLPMIR